MAVGSGWELRKECRTSITPTPPGESHLTGWPPPGTSRTEWFPRGGGSGRPPPSLSGLQTFKPLVRPRGLNPRESSSEEEVALTLLLRIMEHTKKKPLKRLSASLSLRKWTPAPHLKPHELRSLLSGSAEEVLCCALWVTCAAHVTHTQYLSEHGKELPGWAHAWDTRIARQARLPATGIHRQPPAGGGAGSGAGGAQTRR